MNVIEDTKKHIALVGKYLHRFSEELDARSWVHDASKLESPEKEMYEVFRPKLDVLDIQSEEYKQALRDMGEGLKHHYAANRHHPEHYENGIDGMNLIDVVEMFCDWTAAAERTGKTLNLDWASERFGIEKGSHLYNIMKNTIGAL